MSSYSAFNRRNPFEADPIGQQAARTRTNLMALASAMVMGGCLPGWNYTTSVARGEASPGTDAQPARVYFSYATDRLTIWVRAALTWNVSGYPTKFTFSYSDDNEASYDNMADQNGNFVLTVAYDGSNYVTGMTWGTS